MSDFITFMAAPAAGCILLATIFTYFGIQVLKREIIFVDLSLAQVAALGTTVAVATGSEGHSALPQLLSLVFVVLGALFFSGTKYLFPKISQEAVIGIVYVVAASLAILIADRSPHAAEHIQHMLNGSILWITWSGVLQLAATIAVVSILLWVFRRPLLELAENYRKNTLSARQKAGWDFIFYCCLGLVIVMAVEKAGIFLIFALLIIPAVCGNQFFTTLGKQFIAGAGIGIGVSLAGLWISFTWDMPTGATLVCSFGVMFLVSLAVSYGIRNN